MITISLLRPLKVHELWDIFTYRIFMYYLLIVLTRLVRRQKYINFRNDKQSLPVLHTSASVSFVHLCQHAKTFNTIYPPSILFLITYRLLTLHYTGNWFDMFWCCAFRPEKSIVLYSYHSVQVAQRCQFCWHTHYLLFVYKAWKCDKIVAVLLQCIM